jgi:DNA-binding protein Fis
MEMDTLAKIEELRRKIQAIDGETAERWEDFTAPIIPIAVMEKILIIRALKQTNGNQSEAARLLGMTSWTLRRRVKQYEEKAVR